MYQFLSQNPILAIVALVIVIAIIVFLIVKWVQKVGLEKVREIVYQGILKAEHNFQQGDNEQKFDFVVQLARSSIPAPFSMFITEKMVRQFVQLSFDLVKDLLDDGKFNGTAKTN